jgi:nicotinamidase/pyrazinamidase
MNDHQQKESGTTPQIHDALILVDIQNDFLPSGNLAVADGDKIIPVINKYIRIFKEKNLPIIATRDWHPPDHCSFKKAGGIWPVHCVAGTMGAEFSDKLDLPNTLLIISKATQHDKDAYSGLDDTSLDDELKKRRILRVWVGGLATDYCVLNTVKDFLVLSYKVILLIDAIKAVNLNPADGKKAESEMINSGARAITLNEIT